MPRFGDYETSEEYAGGARATVWQARAVSGRSREVFAVKVCRPSEWADDEAQAEEGVAAFAESAAELQQMGQRSSTHWVSVRALGSEAGEAWFVAPFFASSLERVIEGRMPVDGPTLYWVVQSIVTGLVDLERELQRPHGNLKPSNIFIDGSGQLRGAPLLLSDLKPRRELALPADRVADFHALGKLVVQLVRRRRADMNAVIGWPLERSGEWKRIGRQGDGWREICNRLLNPTPSEVDLDLAQLSAALEPLGRRGVKPWVIVVAGVLPLCALAGGTVYLRVAPYADVPDRLKHLAEQLGNEPPDTKTVPAEWGLLCGAYYEWLGEFLATAENPVKSAVWARDSYLKENVLAVLEAAKTRNDSFDPRRFDRQIAGRLPDLQANPPEVAKKGAVVRRVLDAYGAVVQVQQAIASWPARARLTALAIRFEASGWTRPAEELRGVAERSAGPVLSAEAINKVLALSGLADRAEALLAELGRDQTVLAGTGDPVLKGLTDYYRSAVASAEGVQLLNRQLGDALHDLGRKVALVQNDWPGKIAHERFLRESFVKDFAGAVSAEVVLQWEREVQEYYFVPPAEDNRQKTDFPGRLRAIAEATAALMDEERAAEKKGPSGETASVRFKAETDAAKKRLEALLAAPLIRKDLAVSAAAVAALEADLRQLEVAIRGVLFQLRPDAVAWLARVRAVSLGAADPALARAWDERRGQLLAGVAAAELSRNPAGFRELRERYHRLELFFAGLVGEGGIGAFAALAAADLPPEFQRELAAAAAERRERAVVELLDLVGWEGAMPRGTVEAFLAGPGVRAAIARQQRSAGELGELGRDFAQVAEIMNQGGGLRDGVETIVAKWREQPAYASVLSAGALGGISRDVEQLRTLERETERETLVAATRSARLGLALAGWRRLGSVAAWTQADNLGAVAETVGALRTRIEREVRAQPRRTALRDELAKESVSQWRAALRGAHDTRAIGLVLARRNDFGVSEADLSDKERFNVRLWELKQVDWFRLAATAAATQRDGAVGQIRALATVGGEAGVQTWLRGLEDVALGDQAGPEAGLATLGPGAVGWSAQVEAEGRRVRYRWRAAAQEHELIFQLVESEKAVPFFLCADEIPVGLFMDLLNAKREVAARFGPWLAAAAGDDDEQRTGPQIWRYNQKQGLRLNDRWTGIPLPTWPKPLYPENISPGAPNRRSPLQYLPPAAALFLARDVLGCRLPSPDEWPVIVEFSGGATPGANRRDATWQREKEFLTAAGVSLDSPLDGDVFWPQALGGMKRGRDAVAVAPQTTDGLVWFADGGPETPASFHHLVGNVAEYLYDPATSRFAVAGGSALSPPEIDPAKVYPVEPAFAAAGFSDVGLRLAFDAPGSLTGRQRLNLLIKNQPFLNL